MYVNYFFCQNKFPKCNYSTTLMQMQHVRMHRVESPRCGYMQLKVQMRYRMQNLLFSCLRYNSRISSLLVIFLVL